MMCRHIQDKCGSMVHRRDYFMVLFSLTERDSAKDDLFYHVNWLRKVRSCTHLLCMLCRARIRATTFECPRNLFILPAFSQFTELVCFQPVWNSSFINLFCLLQESESKQPALCICNTSVSQHHYLAHILILE